MSFILQGYGKSSKVFTESKKNICLQMFQKVVAFESFAKLAVKHLCWSHFLKKLQA